MSAGFPISFLLQVQGDSEVKNKLQGVSGSLDQVGNSAEKAGTQVVAVQRNYSQAALGMSAAAAAGASLFFQFDNLEKAGLRVETAQKNLTSAQASAASTSATLISLQEKGILDGPRYEAAVLNAKSAQEQLAIAQQKVGIAQGDLSESQIQFALSVVPTVIGAVSSASMAVKGLGFGLTTVGTVGAPIASRGMGQFGMAARLAQLAMGPFGLAMLAIGTVFTLVATNAFGIRDALDSFAKKVEEIFPFLKPVFDFFRNIAQALFPETKAETQSLEQQFQGSFTNITQTVDSSTSQQTASLAVASGSFTDFQTNGSTQLATLAENVDKSADSIVSDAARIDKALGGAGIKIASPAINLSSSSPQQTRTIPNPIGAPITVPVSKFGSFDIAKLRAQGGIPNTNVVVEIDGQKVAAAIKKYSTSGMLGMT